MNKSDKQAYALGVLIGYILSAAVSAAVYAWWSTWILPHFGKNIGFWPLFAVFTVVIGIVVPQKYTWLITCFLAVPTISIWLGFVD